MNTLTPHQPGSATSLAAAEAIEPHSLTMLRQVRAYFQERGEYGATDEEVQSALNMPGSTQRPRRVNLCERGEVYDTGTTRKTKSGRMATVWRITN